MTNTFTQVASGGQTLSAIQAAAPASAKQDAAHVDREYTVIWGSGAMIQFNEDADGQNLDACFNQIATDHPESATRHYTVIWGS
jgi:hypothetical protein